jgi:hypothetical protein
MKYLLRKCDMFACANVKKSFAVENRTLFAPIQAFPDGVGVTAGDG